jgi:hypothetical protein
MVISDKQFDSQFDKVANLTHYPWIGSGYASSTTYIMYGQH